MRTSTLFAVLGLSALAVAQSPLIVNPTSGPVTGLVGTYSVAGCNFYDLNVTTTVTLQALRIPTASPAGTEGSINFYMTAAGGTHVGNETNPGVWTLMASGPVTSNGPFANTLACLTPGVVLQPGTYGIAVEHIDVWSEIVPVSNLTQAFATTEMSIANGAAQLTPFATAPLTNIGPLPNGQFAPAARWRVQFLYAIGNVPHACSSSATFGIGSVNKSASFFQQFVTSAAANGALQGRSILMTFLGNGYAVTPGTATYVPVGTVGTPVPGPTNDDGEVSVTLNLPIPYPTDAGGSTTNTLWVHSNGYVSVDQQSQLTPQAIDADDAINATATAWYSWHDFNPAEAGSGAISIEEDLVNGIVYVTYENVESYPAGASNPSTVQFQFDATNGNVQILWQQVDAAGGSPWFGGDYTVIGWSPGGESPLTEPFDITTLAGFVVDLPELFPLQLEVGGSPLIGGQVDLITSNETGTSFGANLISQSVLATPVPLDPFGAAPGSFAWLAPGSSFLNVISNIGGVGSMSLPVPIPNDPTLAGFVVYSQSIWIDPAGSNLFDNMTVSNGVTFTVGSF